MKKTTRNYGEIFCVIRKLAMELKRFTAPQLCPPLTRAQAFKNCNRLVQAGELDRLTTSKRIGWREVVPGIYKTKS